MAPRKSCEEDLWALWFCGTWLPEVATWLAEVFTEVHLLLPAFEVWPLYWTVVINVINMLMWHLVA